MSFRQDGYVLLPGLCNADEIFAYRSVIAGAVADQHRQVKAMDDRNAFSKAFLQSMQLRRRNTDAARFVLARRFGEVAARLLGVNAVRIYHDQALFKEPGGGINPTPWHQDLYYWPFDDETACGMWMPLVDVTAEMGAMRYAIGTQRSGYLGDVSISEESTRIYDKYIAEHGIDVVEIAPLRAGDALFHYGWTVHAAGANRSNKMREAMIVTFYADGMRVGTITNTSKEYDRNTFLGGRAVGEIADHPNNDVVYRASA